MYKVYLGDVLFPIAPSNIEIRTSNKNKTAILIDEGEINFLRNAGLTNIGFDLLIPSVKYPFAIYEDGFKSSLYYLNHIKMLKINKQPFQFRVVRTWANGKMLSFEFNMQVSLEQYTIKDDVNDGFDIKVSVNLKQYRKYGTKIGTVTFSTGHAKTYQYTEPVINDIKEERQTDNSPINTKKKILYTTSYGITVSELARKYYGHSMYAHFIYEANKNLVEEGKIDKDYIKGNTVVVIPEFADNIYTDKEFWRSIPDGYFTLDGLF